MRTVLATCLLTLAIGATSGVQAQSTGQLYQWKDANGVTHYSQTPPPRGSYQTRTVNPRSSTPASTSQTPAAAPASDAVAATPQQRSCAQARTNLQHLQSDRPVEMEGGDGTALTPEQRTAQIEMAQAVIRAQCN